MTRVYYELTSRVKLTMRPTNTLPRWTCLPRLSQPTPSAQNNGPLTNIADVIIDLPHLAGWKTRVRVMARIPKGKRIKAEALSALLINAVQNKTEYARARLFGFAYGVLK